MNWKLNLMKILECVEKNEGTVFEFFWDLYGVSKEDQSKILSEFHAYKNELDELGKALEATDESLKYDDRI